MKLFKIFSFLLLLLSGFSGNTTTFVQEWELSEENLITAEFSEDSQEQLQSTLTSYLFVDSNLYLGDRDLQNLVFRSNFIAGVAEIYLNWSSTIQPSLGIPEIIFPFHSFL